MVAIKLGVSPFWGIIFTNLDVNAALIIDKSRGQLGDNGGSSRRAVPTVQAAAARCVALVGLIGGATVSSNPVHRALHTFQSTSRSAWLSGTFLLGVQACYFPAECVLPVLATQIRHLQPKMKVCTSAFEDGNCICPRLSAR